MLQATAKMSNPFKDAKTGIAFNRELHRRMDDYFQQHNLSKKSDGRMHLKLAVAAVWWAGSLALLFSVNASSLLFAALYIFHCLAQLFILLNIAHDANHHAIFSTNWVNKLLCYSFDLCGVNSYMWRCLHHQQHHYCINIHGEDETLIARGLFRFTTETKRKFIHRFQHIYFLIPYGMFTADWVLTKDFECFFFPHTEFLKKNRHPFQEYVKMFLSKILYIGYMIVIPVVWFDFSVGFVIVLFFIGHFVIGVIGGTIIQITHPLEDADFPKNQKEFSSFAYHVLATTADYAVESRLAKCFYGGLNLHVAHHLAPHVCHTHYPELTRIIKQTCIEYNVPYRENRSLLSAVHEHYLLLRRLGTA